MVSKSLALILVILVAATGAVLAAPVATGDLLELIDVEKAAYLRDSVCSQISSYDPSGLNDDGFSGAHSFLRKEGEDFVIFDAQGPGCLYRIWSANPGKGWIKLYFDGEATPRVQFDHWEDMFKDVKYPFVAPLSQTFIGGWCSYIPLPFARSLKIVAQGPVRFLQFTWHKFPSADGMKTFDPNYSASERMKLVRVKRAWTKLGEPPMPFPSTSQSIQKSASIRGNSTAQLAKLSGAGMVRGLKLQVKSDDPKILRKLLLLVNVDGQKTPNVYSSLGDYFLDPFADQKAQSLLVGEDPNGGYYSYFVMPYSSGAAIRIKNESKWDAAVDYEVVYEPMKALPPDMGRFFAWWHRQNPTVDGELFPILDAKGRGQWLGVSHAMRNDGRGLGYLEGDEMLWIDGRDNSHFNGTGTEDYFNGGWYFRNPGSAPLYGCGFLDNSGRCHAYRIHLTDLVPFQQKARIGIEHGRESKVAADYAGVTYWYAAPGTTHQFSQTALDARIDRPASVRGVIEAEAIADGITKKGIVNDMDYPFFLNGGKAALTDGKKPASELQFTIDAPEAAIYQLEIGFVKGPSNGIAEVSVDGQASGKAVDTFAEQVAPARTPIGVTPLLSKGRHTVTVRAASKNTASAGSDVMVDYVIWNSDLQYEGERLNVISKPEGMVLKDSVGVLFSGGGHLLLFAEKPGDSFTVRIPVREARNYTISAEVAKARRYGIFQVKVDGKPLGEPVDTYSNRAMSTALVKFGEVELTAGDHDFTFEVTGKNAEAMNAYIGIDTFSLK